MRRLRTRFKYAPRCSTNSLMLALICLLVMLIPSTPLKVAAQNSTPTPLPLFALPDTRSRAHVSNTIAIANDTRTMVAANMINNSVTILIPQFDRVVAEIPVGNDPRSVAITPDGTRALVTNRGDGTLSVISLSENAVTATIPLEGVLPYGVVSNSDTTAYVALQGSDQIAVVNLSENRVSSRIDTPDAPSGLTLWGDFLYVTHFWSGDLSLIYLPQGRVVQTVSTGSDTAVFQNIEPDITRGVAYLPQTRLNAQNRALTYDSAAFAVVNTVSLRDLSAVRERRIALDTADRPVNLPFAAALDRFAQRLYVANAGSDNISVIDLNTGAARANIAVGANPRGILLNGDNTLLYVHSALDGTITTIDTRTLTVSDVLPIINLSVSLDLLLGAQLFHSARDPRLSAGSSLSCATCHFDGQSDGRVWQGFPDGPRNTPVLYRLPETVPYNASATWDELADVELKIRWLQAGTGLIEEPLVDGPHAGMSVDLDLLTHYLTTLPAPPSPYTFPDAVVERGREVFEAQGCTECHVGPAATDLQRHDVGTGVSPLEKQGTAFDTPSLRWLWLSAPYFHDGSAETLDEVFELPGEHQLIFDVAPDDLHALMSYLLTLGD